MTAAQPVRILAIVDTCERPAVELGARLLDGYLARAGAEPLRPIAVTFAGIGEHAGATTPDIVIASLMTELDDPHASARAPARWATHLGTLRAHGAPVFLCTIFRHVTGRGSDLRADETLAAIRRLNLLAVELSHAHAAGVIDIDRSMAHFGARTLRSDFRLTGRGAEVVAGHAIAHALLGYGIDALGDPVTQDKARGLLGGLERVIELLQRLAPPRAGTTAPHG